MKQGDLFADPPPEAELEEPEAAAPEPPSALPAAPTERRRPPRGRGTARPAVAVPDAAARRAAVTTFERPLLLSAGAGTGKTATLVARVVHWGLGPGWDEAAAGRDDEPETVALRVLRGVAAITFTEAAAAEMSARLGQALARIQRATSGGTVDAARMPIGLALDALPDDAGVLNERARALRSALDHLNVGTIHAFCRRLLAAHPLAVGMDPAFEVDATFSRTEVCVRDVIERDLEEHWQDPVDPALVELARKGIGPPDVEAAVIALVEAGARAEDFAQDPLDEATCRRLVEALRARLESLWPLAAPVRRAASKSEIVVTALERTRDLLGRGPDGSRAGLAELAQGVRKVWNADGERAWEKLKDWGKGTVLVKEGSLLGPRREELVAAAADLRTSIETFRALDPAHLDAARRVVHRILSGVEAELRRLGVATFGDLLVEARRLLLEHPDVAAGERRKLRQLLVDEFQDTDQVQCDVVEALALAGPPAERPSLFLVGDPKQSIFAWRNADLAAFDAFLAKILAAGGSRLELVANFRSRRSVLAEVERCVRPVMEEVPRVQPAFVPLEAARPDADLAPAGGPDGPDLEFWVSWPRDPATGLVTSRLSKRLGPSYEVEARALARDLARRHAKGGVAWKDFAVVFRALTGIEPYLQEMRELGVPYEVQSERNYYKRREVLDATALALAVLDPTDALAIATLLRSPLVGVPDAALPLLWAEGFPKEVARLRGPDEEHERRLDELVGAAARRVPADIPGLAEVRGWEASLRAAVHALALARRSFREDPVDRFVEVLTGLFLPDAVGAARFLGAYRLANLERFFRDLQRTVEERAGDVTSVVRNLRSNLGRTDRTEASRPADSGQDAVQVLTVHGAKGLEFRHLYLAQTHKSDSREDDGPAFDRRGDDAAYRLLGVTSPGWFETKRRRDVAEAAERVRLLYVALTRARERLVVLGGLASEPKGKPWRDARNVAQLLEHRAHADEAVKELQRRARAGDATPYEDEAGASWRLAAFLAEAPLQGGAAGGADGAGGEGAEAGSDARSVESVARESRRLAERRATAAARASRPLHAAASAEAHVDAAEWHAARRFAEAEAGVEPGEGTRDASEEGAAGAATLSRAAAQAAGTAVHRVLEELDLALDPAAAAEAGKRRLPSLLAGRVLADELEPTSARAAELLERAAANGLLARLLALQEHVVARELALLEPPPDDDEGPVGFVSGAIDLVYRDPEEGELVVADFKTDPVEGAELDARAAGYAPQGRAYVRALRAALDLPAEPRFELWFLHAGRVVRT